MSIVRTIIRNEQGQALAEFALVLPVLILLLFGMVVRLAVGRGKRYPAFFLMAAAVAVVFVTDTLYTWILLHGSYDNTTGLLELGWGFARASFVRSVRLQADPPLFPHELGPRFRLR